MSRFGVVLSSGGTRGVFAHTGFMAGLQDIGIAVDASSGCSAGAIVGGVIASGQSIESWVASLTHIRTGQFWTPISLGKLFYLLLINKGRGLTGVSDPTPAIRYLQSQLQAQTYEECLYPFSSVAVDLDTVTKRIFDKGPLAAGIMASAAMPGFYAPVEIDGRLFCDGAIHEFAPAEAICCRYGLDVLIVHHVQSLDFTRAGLQRALAQPWSMFDLLQRVIFSHRPWYATGAPISFMPCPCGCKAVVVIVEPSLPEWAWPITEGGERVLEAARSHAVDRLGRVLGVLNTNPHALLGNQVQTLKRTRGQ